MNETYDIGRTGVSAAELLNKVESGAVVTEHADKVAEIILNNTATAVTEDGANPVSGNGVAEYVEERLASELANKADKEGFVVADSWLNKSVSDAGIVSDNNGFKLVIKPIKKGQTAVCITGVDSTRAAISFAETIDAASVTMVMAGTAKSASVVSYLATADGYVYMLYTASTTPTYMIYTPSVTDRIGITNVFKGRNMLERYVGSDYSDESLWGAGFLNANGGVTSNSTYRYTRDYIPVVAGDYLSRVNFSGNARLVVYDETKTPIQYLTTGNQTITKARTFDAGAAYVRVSCDQTPTSDLLSLVYQGEDVVIENIPRVNQLTTTTALAQDKLSVIENNLSTEGEWLDPTLWTIEDESGAYSADNYGKPNVRYNLSLPSLPDKLRIAVDFRCTRALAAASGKKQKIITVGNVLSFFTDMKNPIYNNGDYYRANYTGLVGNGSMASITNSSVIPCFRGDTLMMIAPKREAADIAGYECCVGFDSVDVRDADGNTKETIAIAEDMALAEVIDTINTTSGYLSVSSRNTIGKVYADLMRTDSDWLPMTATVGSVLDTRPHWIGAMHDEAWHTIEIVINFAERWAYGSFDGATSVRVEFNEPTSNEICIGGLSGVTDYRLTPLQFRNLRLDIGGWGDAEIITYPGVVEGTKTQLISNRNPRLIIWEGHGVEDIKESDEHPNVMDISTDRLNYLFRHLDSKGYVTVTWEQVKAWKVNGAPLPKRCYVTMFDDFRVYNYLSFGNRLPFDRFGVRAGLAILTNHERNESITIDGVEWTVGEAIDTIVREGWHPVSHTPDHTRLDTLRPSEALAVFKEWALDAQRLGIYDDILVYPEGRTSATSINALRQSGFVLGVMVEQNTYPCRALDSYRLPRIVFAKASATIEWLEERIV